MAFGATLTVTVNAVAKVLNRINQDNYGSEYLLRSATDEYRVKIRHSKVPAKGTRVEFDRHNVEISHTIFATVTDAEVFRRQYVVLENGYNDNLTNVGYMVAGFIDYMDSATVQGDLLTWQN